MGKRSREKKKKKKDTHNNPKSGEKASGRKSTEKKKSKGPLCGYNGEREGKDVKKKAQGKKRVGEKNQRGWGKTNCPTHEKKNLTKISEKRRNLVRGSGKEEDVLRGGAKEIAKVEGDSKPKKKDVWRKPGEARKG